MPLAHFFQTLLACFGRIPFRSGRCATDAERRSPCSERLNQTGKVMDFELDTIPASRLRGTAIWYRLGRAT